MPTYLGKLTSYMSQDDRSAKKKSYNVTVTQLEGQTCHPPNPHFGWRPFTSWICLQSEHVFARYAFLISSQSSFRLVTVFDSWICMKSDHVFTSEGFFLILCQSSFQRGAFWLIGFVHRVINLDRFIKTFFWNFKQCQMVLYSLSLYEQKLEKTFCSNVAPS